MSDHTRPRLLRATTVESRAVLLAVGCFLVGGVVGVIAFGSTSVPISGRGSLGDVTAVTAAILGLLVFLVAYLTVPGRRDELPGRFGSRLLDIGALAFAHGAIVLLAWGVLFAVVQQAFIDAVVFPLTAALLAGAGAALTGYFVFLSASSMTSTRMAALLCVFLVLGVLTSMLTSTDPYWWQMNFSALGAGAGVSTATFNLTLLVAGVLIVALTHYLTFELAHGQLAHGSGDTPERSAKRVGELRLSLVLIGVFLSCVGIFPVDVIEPVHNAVATGMLVVWSILVFRLPRVVPGVSRTFLVVGYVFFAVIVGAAVLFFTGYYNLTAVELLAFALIFTWLFVLVRNVSAAASDAAESRQEVAEHVV